MGKIYYHNLTKGIFNENDLGDAVESADPGDVIKFTARGCAIVFDINAPAEDEGEEYDYVREDFKRYFDEYHSPDYEDPY
ncbi:hypothetical protein [Flavobacterium psychrotrophum]|uniref:hypothetical protein n=1 Tax=Flavobacterium psychrotrophum TaxID=2294119 RepID=UPI000E316745|nr:hypothetical protein [Flavobacterium psychrotrophum]